MARITAVCSGALLVAALVAAAAVPGATGATQAGEQSSFVVTLDADGSAEMAATLRFDLGAPTGSAAFEEFRSNETAREHLRTTFRDQMRAAAANASNATGREMTVENASVHLSTANNGNVGVVVLSARWTGLAAVENGTLVVTEPFATEFQPDRTFVVEWPDRYGLERANPPPDSTSETSATWRRDTDLEGFELVVAESASDGDGGVPGVPVPGFGVGVALVALLVAVVTSGGSALGLRRRA